MTEFRKEASLAGVIAVIAALGIGILAIGVFPSGPSVTSTTASIVTPSTMTTVTESGPSGPLPPVALTGYLYADNVSCSLTTSVCTFTIVNNSTTPLELVTCSVVVSSGGSTSGSSRVNGTIGGPASAGIPADSQVVATCAVPASQLTDQTKGSVASGTFMVKLVKSWYSYPAGTEPTFGFQGSWS